MSDKILKPTIQVTIFSFIGIGLGFANQIILAYYFGSGAERDAYFAASTIPLYISSVFLGSIGAVFLSSYINVKTQQSEIDAKIFLNSVINSTAVILGVITVLGIIFSKQILRLSVPGFNEAELNIASENLRILFPTIIFIVLLSVLGSVYQSVHHFLIPAIEGVITPILSLIVVVVANKWMGIRSLSWATLWGNLLSFLFLLGFLIRRKQLIFKWSLNNKHLKVMLISALPLLFAGFIYRFSSVWERVVASKLPQGSISYLGYGNQLLAAMAVVTTGGISTIFFPLLSKAWSEGNMIALKNYFSQGIRILLCITIPVTLLFLVVRMPVIALFFERGKFDHTSTIGVSNTLAFMMGAFIFQSLGGIIVRAFYFMNMTVKLSIISAIEVFLYVVFSFIFCKYYSYAGLAIALSLSAMCNVLMSSYFINKKIKFLNKKLAGDFFRVLFASFVPYLAIVCIQRFTGLENIFAIGLLYLLFYAIMILFILPLEETVIIRKKFLK